MKNVALNTKCNLVIGKSHATCAYMWNVQLNLNYHCSKGNIWTEWLWPLSALEVLDSRGMAAFGAENVSCMINFTNDLIQYLSFRYHLYLVPYYTDLLELILLNGLISIAAWINNYIYHKMSDETAYLYPNFNGAAVEVWEWISNFIPHFTRCVQ